MKDLEIGSKAPKYIWREAIRPLASPLVSLKQNHARPHSIENSLVKKHTVHIYYKYIYYCKYGTFLILLPAWLYLYCVYIYISINICTWFILLLFSFLKKNCFPSEWNFHSFVISRCSYYRPQITFEIELFLSSKLLLKFFIVNAIRISSDIFKGFHPSKNGARVQICQTILFQIRQAK